MNFVVVPKSPYLIIFEGENYHGSVTQSILLLIKSLLLFVNDE